MNIFHLMRSNHISLEPYWHILYLSPLFHLLWPFHRGFDKPYGNWIPSQARRHCQSIDRVPLQKGGWIRGMRAHCHFDLRTEWRIDRHISCKRFCGFWIQGNLSFYYHVERCFYEIQFQCGFFPPHCRLRTIEKA